MNKNNKNFKQMNILMILCIVFFGEFFAYLNDLYLGAKFNNGKLFAPYSMKIEKFSDIYNKARKKGFGKEYGEQYKQKPVLLFGGSYAYGYGLKDDETLASQLSQYIKKPVYNLAYQTWCVQNMLWQLKNSNIYNEIKEPSVIIYMGVKADLENIYNPDILNGLKYKMSNGILVEVPFHFMLLNYSYLYKKINHEISYRKTLNKEKNIEFFSKHILAAKKEADKHWKNYKMVVVWYNLPVKNEFSELEESGIEVISLYDFIKKNILSKNTVQDEDIDIHPDKDTWRKIVPEIAKNIKFSNE